MNERIKELRKILNLTLEMFGKRLGVTKSAMSNIENGNRNITEQMILSICREFSVNELWLRKGTGEIFKELPENEIIKRATILLGEKDPLFEAFVLSYSKLNKTNRKVIIDFGMDFLNELKTIWAGKEE